MKKLILIIVILLWYSNAELQWNPENRFGNWDITGDLTEDDPNVGGTYTKGDFQDSTWAITIYGSNTVDTATYDGRLSLSCTYVDNSNGCLIYFRDDYNLSGNLTIGSFYQVDFLACVSTGSVSYWIYDGANYSLQEAVTSTTWLSFNTKFEATSLTDCFILIPNMSAGETAYLDSLRIREITSYQNFNVANTQYDLNTANRFGDWYTLVFSDDFTSDITGWLGFQSVSKHYQTDYNSVGRVNVLIDSATGTNALVINSTIGTLTNGKAYKLEVRYYIPSSNISTNKITPVLREPGLTLAKQLVIDDWTFVTIYFISGGQTDIRFIQDESATNDDIIYIDDVAIYEVTSYQNPNPSKNKWDYNPIDLRWVQDYNANEQVALQVSPHVDLTTAILDSYPALYGIKKLWRNAGDSVLRFHRDSDSTQTTIGFLTSGYADTISVNTFGSGTTLRVVRWVDQSGNDNTAVQNTIADMPLWHNINGLVFDGVSDYMTNNMGEFNQPNTFIMTGLFRQTNTKFIFNGTVNTQAVYVQSWNNWAMYAGANLKYIYIIDMNDLICMFNESNSSFIVDGVKTEGNVGTNAIINLTLSAHYQPSLFGQNNFKSFIFSKYGLTQTQSESIITYLNE